MVLMCNNTSFYRTHFHNYTHLLWLEVFTFDRLVEPSHWPVTGNISNTVETEIKTITFLNNPAPLLSKQHIYLNFVHFQKYF